MTDKHDSKIIDGLTVKTISSKDGVLIREMIFDELSSVVPGSKEKKDHLELVHSEYVDKPKAE